MKNYKTLALAVALGLGAIGTAQATLVNGTIGFTGQAMYDTGSAGTATQVSSWSSAGVLGTDGVFTAIPNFTSVTFAAPWTFNSGPVATFWTVTSGGQTFTFDLVSSYIASQGGGAIAVKGTGFVTGTGTTAYQSTALDWSFTSQDPKAGAAGWTFSASSSSVPEPSTIVAGALLLLPFGISTVRILRKNKSA